MDAVRSDVDRRAELSLIALRKSHKEMEEVMGLEETVTSLRQDYASQIAINAELQGKITSLESRNVQLQTALDDLVQSKSAIDHDVNRLIESVKEANVIIDSVIQKNRQLSSDKKLLLAKIEALEIDLSTSEEYQQALEEQLAASQGGDKTVVAATPLKENLLTDHNTSPKAANSQSQIDSLRLSIDRLQRKFDRLHAKKESAEKKYYKSYVEWHEFKTWWKAFSQYPGVAPRVRQFNRDTRNGALIGCEVNGKPLKMPQINGQSLLFPDVDERPHDDPHQLEESNREPSMAVVYLPPEQQDGANSSPRSKASHESFDPEQTQETTPSKSQKSLFDVVIRDMNIPPLQIYSPAITSAIGSTPATTSTPIPTPQSSSTVKDESQDSRIFLKSPVTNSFTTPHDPKHHQLVLAQPSSILGKRKSPPDDISVQSSTRSFVPLRLQHVDGSIVTDSPELTKRKRGLIEEVKRANDYEVADMKHKEGSKNDSPNTTINARYEINPAQNSGVNFAFDEVVRNKDARRKLQAGACECCKDYYAAVGPLPPRLQPPLWKSPTSSPTTATGAIQVCKIHGESGDMRDDDDEENARIVAHQQGVSRHRYQWERPKTPPGFWNIGFPTTQEVAGKSRSSS